MTSLLLTSHISARCVAELLALMVSPSPSRSPSRSLSPPGIRAPACEGEGDGGCSASVQNNVRGPWSSQKWHRATRAFIWKTGRWFHWAGSLSDSLFWECKQQLQNQQNINNYMYCCYFTFKSSEQPLSGITRVWQSRVHKKTSNRLTSAKQPQSTNVWCSKPLRVKTFAWSQTRHRLKINQRERRINEILVLFFLGSELPWFSRTIHDSEGLAFLVLESFLVRRWLTITDNDMWRGVTRSIHSDAWQLPVPLSVYLYR